MAGGRGRPKIMPQRQAAAQRRKVEARTRRCLDCGEEGETVGHMGCQYPGRHSWIWEGTK